MTCDEFWNTSPLRWSLCDAYRQVATVIGWGKAIDLGMYAWHHKRPPSRAKGYDVRGSLSISAGADAPLAKEIAGIIGEDAARKLRKMFGGEQLWFGSLEPASIPRRNRAVVESVQRNDFYVAPVAVCFGLSQHRVRQIWHEQTGIPFTEAKAAHRAAIKEQGATESV